MLKKVILRLKRIRNFLLVNIIWKRHQIGKNFHVGARVRLWGKNNLVIGENVYIGRDSQVQCDAIIGNYVMLGNKVGLVGRYDHNYQQIGVPIILSSKISDPDYDWKGLSLKIVIEDDVWIGYGSIILSGVKIGQGSIIAAGSVVTKDVDAFSIYAGIPAIKLSDRFVKAEDLAEHIRLYNINYSKKLR